MTLEQRVEKARGLFKAGYNCAQSVILAYNDLLGMDDRSAATLSAPFGGGMGRLREVCGAVSSMSMAAGILSPAPDPSNKEAKSANYALVQRFAEEFRAENGDIVCRNLLGFSQHKDAPEPSDRTPEYYRKRPCVEYVACAARIIGQYLTEQGKEL